MHAPTKVQVPWWQTSDAAQSLLSVHVGAEAQAPPLHVCAGPQSASLVHPSDVPASQPSAVQLAAATHAPSEQASQ